jgi:hypothetical protein
MPARRSNASVKPPMKAPDAAPATTPINANRPNAPSASMDPKLSALCASRR